MPKENRYYVPLEKDNFKSIKTKLKFIDFFLHVFVFKLLKKLFLM